MGAKMGEGKRGLDLPYSAFLGLHKGEWVGRVRETAPVGEGKLASLSCRTWAWERILGAKVGNCACR